LHPSIRSISVTFHVAACTNGSLKFNKIFSKQSWPVKINPHSNTVIDMINHLQIIISGAKSVRLITNYTSVTKRQLTSLFWVDYWTKFPQRIHKTLRSQIN
jgi:hypothetical protein